MANTVGVNFPEDKVTRLARICENHYAVAFCFTYRIRMIISFSSAIREISTLCLEYNCRCVQNLQFPNFLMHCASEQDLLEVIYIIGILNCIHVCLFQRVRQRLHHYYDHFHYRVRNFRQFQRCCHRQQHLKLLTMHWLIVKVSFIHYLNNYDKYITRPQGDFLLGAQNRKCR